MIGDFFTVVGMLILVVGILVLCWFSTRKLAGLGRLGQGGTHIRLLDQASLGQDKAVAIVSVGEKYLLLGIAPGGISVLTELDEASLETSPVETGGGQMPNFKQILENLKDRKRQGNG